MSSRSTSTEPFEKLYRFSEIIIKTSELEDIYSAALSAIQELLKVDRAAIQLFDSDGRMHFKAYLNLSQKFMVTVDGHNPWNKDSKNPQPVLIPDALKDKSLSHVKKAIRAEGIKSLGFFPLLSNNYLIGKFTIYYNEPHHFTEEEVKLAQIIGSHISFAINKKKAADNFLNVLSDGIIIFDSNWRLIFVNRAAALASGYKNTQDMMGNPLKWKNLFELKDEKGSPLKIEDLPGRKTLKDKKNFQMLIQSKNVQSGQTRWVIDKSSPVLDESGKVQYIINILHDVTERIELEKRKDRFISTASHELKTPIATLKGYAQILEKLGTDDKNSKYYLSKINSQINRLLTLVDDLLDVSRIHYGKLRLQKSRFNLVRQIKETAYDFQQISPNHQIIVKNGVPKGFVYADRQRLDEVLTNLLSNAVKFSPKSDKIILRLKNSKEEVVVSIKDFGIGISRESYHRMFEPFFQESNRIRQSFSGLGLGLYISSQIIREHRGKIWVKSEKGKGSTFFFSLPIS